MLSKFTLGAAWALAAVHLFLAFCGGWCVFFDGISALHLPGKFEKAIRTYQVYSGTNTAYSFFAPWIGTEYRVRFFDVSHSHRKELSFPKMYFRETEIRLGNIVNTFRDTSLSEAEKRSVLASLAATVLNRYPGVTKISVTLEEYQLPDMAETRSGQVPDWKTLFKVDFKESI